MSIFNEILDYFNQSNFESSRRFSKNHKYSTHAIKDLLTKLKNPQNEYKTIHIAGTYGKSSMTQLMSRFLNASSQKCGTYTSPHLLRFNERFVIDKKEITNEEVKKIWDTLLPFIETDSRISFFDCLTAIAFLWFKQKKVTWAVIETGLGGRLDSTNHINSEFTIITPIGLDHTHILGNTIEEIAYEKAGIIKKNKKIYSFKQTYKIHQILEEEAQKKNTQYIDITQNRTFENYNIENYTYAKYIYENFFNTSVPKINQQLKGHLEILLNNPLIIYDSAHNEKSIQFLFNYLNKKYYTNKKNNALKVFFNITKDRNLNNFIEIIKSFTDNIYLFITENDILYNLKTLKDKKISYNKIKIIHQNEVILMIKKSYSKTSNYSKEENTSIDKPLFLFTGTTYLYKNILKIIQEITI